MNKYSYRDTIYSIEYCSKKEIPSHIERVIFYWKNIPIEERYKELEESINNNLAYKIVANNKEYLTCYLVIRNNKRLALLLWSLQKKVTYMLADYLATIDKRDVYWYPSSKDCIPYQFLVSLSAIKNYRLYNRPITITYNKALQEQIDNYFIRRDIRRL